LAILPNKVVDLAKGNGFAVVFFRLTEGSATERVRKRFWFVNASFLLLNSVVRFLSRGKLESLLLDNCFMMLQKRGAA